METNEYKLFKIGTKRVGFLLLCLAAIGFVTSMIVSNFQVNAMIPEEVNTYVIVYRSIDIATVFGSVMGVGLALVGIGKYGENQKLKIEKEVK